MSSSIHDFAAEQVTRRLHTEFVQSEDQTTCMALNQLMIEVRSFHRDLDMDTFHAGVELLLPLAPTDGRGHTAIHNLSSLVGASNPNGEVLSIEIRPNGTYEYTFVELDCAPAEGFVKYVIIPFREEFVVTKDHRYQIERPHGLVSPFALPYFRELEAALSDYYVHRARKGDCLHLNAIWADPERLVLSNRPEHHMRRSLHSFLSSRLLGVKCSVFQEQNVDETMPVDIRVQWLDSRRISLIEIKWLGDSVSTSRGRVSTSYRDSRALEGYTQAVDYMDRQRATLRGSIVRTRLVVFDARRSGVVHTEDSTSCSDPWSFERAEIDYASVKVDDPGIDAPIRYFLEPLVVRS